METPAGAAERVPASSVLVALATSLHNPAAAAAGMTTTIFVKFKTIFSRMTPVEREDTAVLLHHLLSIEDFKTVVAVLAEES